MEPSDLMRFAVTGIERLGLQYLITGSMASIFYGEPRFTNDIDIVIDLPPNLIKQFCRLFPDPEYYVNEEAVREAVAQHTQFNVIHPSSGLKIDFMIPEPNPYNRNRFVRSQRVEAGEDYKASFASPEDVIIKKMEFYREAGSEKHLRDILGIMSISGERLEFDYISEWAGRLNLQAVWNEVQKRGNL